MPARGIATAGNGLSDERGNTVASAAAQLNGSDAVKGHEVPAVG